MWHKVSEALPPVHMNVIVRVSCPGDKNPAYFQDTYHPYTMSCGSWGWEEAISDRVTHWTPLPEMEECPTCGQKKPL